MRISVARFKKRVQVISASGRTLFHCPPTKARELVLCGSACLLDTDINERRYWRILLLRTPVDRARPSRQLNVRSYMGQSYTYKEHVDGRYYIQQFKRIHRADRWAYQQAVLDTLRD